MKMLSPLFRVARLTLLAGVLAMTLVGPSQRASAQNPGVPAPPPDQFPISKTAKEIEDEASKAQANTDPAVQKATASVGNGGNLASLIGSNVFPNLPQYAANGRHLFTLVAGVILTAGLIFGFWNANTGYDKLRLLTTTMLLVGAMVMVPLLMNLTLAACDQIAELGGASAMEVAQKADGLQNVYASPAMQGTFNAPAAASADPNTDAATQAGKSSSWMPKWADEMLKGMTAAAAKLSQFPMVILKSVLTGLCCGIAQLFLLVSAAVAYIFLTIRYFLVFMGSALLPVFIALLATQNFRSLGVKYIMNLVGVCSWPIGYALGHMGTLALFEWTYNSIATAVHAPVAAALKAAATPGGGAGAIAAAAALMGPAYQVSAIGGLLTATFCVIILCLWILMVTFCAPFVMMSVVQSGSSFFNAMAAGTAKAGAAVAGSALTIGGLGLAGAAGGAGAGAGGAGGAEGAASGGKGLGGGDAPTLGGGEAGGESNSVDMLGEGGGEGGDSGQPALGNGGGAGGGQKALGKAGRAMSAAVSAFSSALEAGATSDQAYEGAMAAGNAAKGGASPDAVGAAAEMAVLQAGGSPDAAQAAGDSAAAGAAASDSESGGGSLGGGGGSDAGSSEAAANTADNQQAAANLDREEGADGAGGALQGAGAGRGGSSSGGGSGSNSAGSLAAATAAATAIGAGAALASGRTGGGGKSGTGSGSKGAGGAAGGKSMTVAGGGSAANGGVDNGGADEEKDGANGQGEQADGAAGAAGSTNESMSVTVLQAGGGAAAGGGQRAGAGGRAGSGRGATAGAGGGGTSSRGGAAGGGGGGSSSMSVSGGGGGGQGAGSAAGGGGGGASAGGGGGGAGGGGSGSGGSGSGGGGGGGAAPGKSAAAAAAKPSSSSQKALNAMGFIAFAAGETLTRASRDFNGDPTSFAHVPTIGFNEKRNYDQQQNQRISAESAGDAAKNSERSAAALEAIAAHFGASPALAKGAAAPPLNPAAKAAAATRSRRRNR